MFFMLILDDTNYYLLRHLGDQCIAHRKQSIVARLIWGQITGEHNEVFAKSIIMTAI